MIELNDEQLEFLSMCYNIENNMPLLENIFALECSIEEAESDSDITYYQNQISKIENKSKHPTIPSTANLKNAR